jgi:hypothetical protein
VASPSPAATTNVQNPKTIPTICGRVWRNPKFAPDAASMTLFGPGVKPATVAKVANEMIVELSIGLPDPSVKNAHGRLSINQK